MCRKILRELLFFLPHPLRVTNAPYPKAGQSAEARSRVTLELLWVMLWRLFLSVHMDRAHNIVFFSNTSMIIKARFHNPEMCGVVMQSTQLITWKAALDREHDKCRNRDRLFLLS